MFSICPVWVKLFCVSICMSVFLDLLIYDYCLPIYYSKYDPSLLFKNKRIKTTGHKRHTYIWRKRHYFEILLCINFFFSKYHKWISSLFDNRSKDFSICTFKNDYGVFFDLFQSVGYLENPDNVRLDIEGFWVIQLQDRRSWNLTLTFTSILLRGSHLGFR